jgi:hypothetical protein
MFVRRPLFSHMWSSPRLVDSLSISWTPRRFSPYFQFVKWSSGALSLLGCVTSVGYTLLPTAEDRQTIILGSLTHIYNNDGVTLPYLDISIACPFSGCTWSQDRYRS